MNIRHVALLAVVLVVAGCGSKQKAEDAAGADAGHRKQAAAEPVAAVLQSTGAPVAKVGFVLLTAPVAGVQSAVRLDISSAAPVPALLVSAEGADIAIDPVTARTSLALEADKIASHELRFTAQHEGIAEITVRLRAGTDGAETVYVIPALVAKAATGG